MELAQAIQQAQSGQLDGFSAIFQHSADSTYFKAASLLESKGNPLVLIHDTYVNAFKLIHTLQSPSDFRVWFGKIFYSKALKYCQSDRSPVDQKTFENQDIASVIKQFDLLPAEQKAILMFSYYDGCSAGQISQIMKLEEVTVKRHIKNSRLKIENGIKSERGAEVKVNAAAFTLAFCQDAKDKKIPIALSDSIFRNICIDSGLLPHSSACEEITFPNIAHSPSVGENEASGLNAVMPAEVPAISQNALEKDELLNESAPLEAETENIKKDSKFSKSIFGKLFKNI